MSQGKAAQNNNRNYRVNEASRRGAAKIEENIFFPANFHYSSALTRTERERENFFAFKIVSSLSLNFSPPLTKIDFLQLFSSMIIVSPSLVFHKKSLRNILALFMVAYECVGVLAYLCVCVSVWMILLPAAAASS
jgi:hypothetical protein